MPLIRALLSLLLLLGLVACAGDQKPAAPANKDTLKVGFVYVGPVGDGGWTTAHDEGRQKMEKALPWVQTTHLDSVPEGADAARAISQLAEQGYKLIFTTSFGYMDPTLEVAARYPDVTFMHCSGYKQSKNVGTYFGKMEQAKFLAGMVAGRMSKTGSLGYVAPHPIPEVIRFIDAFTLGARAVNPNAKVKVVWTNSWFDPGKEREAALALLDAGADVLASGADSTAHLRAAEERGAYAIGYDSDARDAAPRAWLTSALWDWSVVYTKAAQQVHDGTWKSEDINLGMDSGLVRLAPMSDLVPAEVQAEVNAAEQEIASGRRDVFAGPLRRQDGTEAFAAGAAPSDEERLRMDWFVEGVDGALSR